MLLRHARTLGLEGPAVTLLEGELRMASSADVRRVVTTVDDNDKAVVLFDGANPHRRCGRKRRPFRAWCG